MTAPRASTSARMPHCKTRCDFVREHRGRLVGVWLARQSSGGIDACVACGESALGVVVAECILRSGRTFDFTARAHAIAWTQIACAPIQPRRTAKFANRRSSLPSNASLG
ncbi:hypothetical protein X946_4336 [Burkholderia sp. ABCPW 111]|nr:hypothetical protein X946_4336 [Burkholderia sp. ABCPW 111]